MKDRGEPWEWTKERIEAESAHIRAMADACNNERLCLRGYASKTTNMLDSALREIVRQGAEIAMLNVALRLCWYEGHELINSVEDEHEVYLKEADRWLAADRKCITCRQCHSTHISGKPETTEFHCDWDRDEFGYTGGTCEFWYWREEVDE
ncbi:MAG: hypothetical protein ABIF19_18085 [Planctomycetota bacterium]